MYVLAFDTTAAQCSIILQKDGTVLDKFNQRMDFGQSEALIPEIKAMLIRQQLDFSELNLVVVCAGPGSFTGVRASISAARAFALACPDLIVSGVSAFDSYINSLEGEEVAELNGVLIETKRNDFYYQIFDNNLQKVTAPSAGEYEDIIAQLRHKKVTLIGDGVERFLSKPSGLSLHCVKMTEALDIKKVADCGYQQWQDKRVDFPKPIYLRLPDVSPPKCS